MQRRAEHYYLFGPFRLDPDEYRLLRGRVVVPLTPKTLAMLLTLIRNHGKLVEKEVLLRELWPDTFVEESNLTFNMSMLRKALGDTAQSPEYVETVPRRGYRFVAPIREFRTEREMKSLAVLPFANLSGQETAEYFVDGMQEMLITQLAQISSLRVISRTSSMRFRLERQSLAAFSRALQLDFAVEGSVLVEGSSVRINVRLIDAVSDTPVWAQSFDRSLHDVLSVQSAVAESIVQRIELKLTPTQLKRLHQEQSIDPEAHAAFLKGRYYWHQFFTKEGLTTAIEHFRKAIHLKPDYARAWAHLSACFAAMAVQAMLPSAEAAAEGKAAAQRALDLDPLSAETHGVMAANLLFYDWDWEATENAIQTSLEISPSCEIHGLFAHYALARGWCRQAIAAQSRALDLDPLSAMMHTDLVWVHLLSRDCNKALELGLSMKHMKFDYPLLHVYLSQAYLCRGEYAKAVEEIEKVAPEAEDVPAPYMAILGHVYGAARRKKDALRIFQRMKELSKRCYVASYDWAVLHAGSGETGDAFRRLNRAIDEKEPRVIWLKVDPLFESIASDKRFQALTRRIGLDD